VTFVYAEKEDVLKVPNAALRFKPPPPMLAELGRSGGAGGGATGPTGGTGPAQASGGGGRAGGGRGPEAPDRRTVWTYQDEKPAPVRIRTGISDGSWTEVVEGNLAPGEVVITDVLGSGRDLSNLRRGL
jgi:HlyD family secretion protein